MYLLQLHSPRKWPFVFVFVIISVALIRHHYQKPLGREGFQCTVPHYSVALREVRARTQTERGQGDRKGPCSVQLTGLFLAACSACSHTHSRTTTTGPGSHISHQAWRCPLCLFTSQSYRAVSHWGSLLSKDSSFCLVDKKEQKEIVSVVIFFFFIRVRVSNLNCISLSHIFSWKYNFLYHNYGHVSSLWPITSWCLAYLNPYI